MTAERIMPEANKAPDTQPPTPAQGPVERVSDFVATNPTLPRKDFLGRSRLSAFGNRVRHAFRSPQPVLQGAGGPSFQSEVEISEAHAPSIPTTTRPSTRGTDTPTPTQPAPDLSRRAFLADYVAPVLKGVAVASIAGPTLVAADALGQAFTSRPRGDSRRAIPPAASPEPSRSPYPVGTGGTGTTKLPEGPYAINGVGAPNAISPSSSNQAEATTDIVRASPTPTTRPTIAPTKPPATESPRPSPTETPVLPIEKVKLVGPGRFYTFPYPGFVPDYYVKVDNATVVAIDDKNDDGSYWFALTIAGNKIKRDCLKPPKSNNLSQLKYCDFSGMTAWFRVIPDTLVWKASGGSFSLLGKGVNTMVDSIKVGETLPSVTIDLTYDDGSYPNYQKAVDINRSTLLQLNEDRGKSFPRSNRRYKMVVGGMTISPPNK